MLNKLLQRLQSLLNATWTKDHETLRSTRGQTGWISLSPGKRIDPLTVILQEALVCTNHAHAKDYRKWNKYRTPKKSQKPLATHEGSKASFAQATSKLTAEVQELKRNPRLRRVAPRSIITPVIMTVTTTPNEVLRPVAQGSTVCVING